MFLETLKRELLAHLIKFRFTITIITCLLLAITTTLIGDESEDLRSEENKALEKLCQLPNNDKRAISWGYVGSYRTAPGKSKKRIAFWWDNIDSFPI